MRAIRAIVVATKCVVAAMARTVTAMARMMAAIKHRVTNSARNYHASQMAAKRAPRHRRLGRGARIISRESAIEHRRIQLPTPMHIDTSGAASQIPPEISTPRKSQPSAPLVTPASVGFVQISIFHYVLTFRGFFFAEFRLNFTKTQNNDIH